MPQSAALPEVVVIGGGHKCRPERDEKRTDLDFAGHGFQLGPVVGGIIAERISTGRSNLPIARFRIDRFARAPAQTAP
jgi:hypothetical protein